MKLITLNVWGGRVSEPLDTFLKVRSKDTDIFCFQEMYHKDPNPEKDVRADLFVEMSAILTGFKAFFRPFLHDYFGVASFIKGSIVIEEEGDTFVYKERGHDPKSDGAANEARNIQYVRIRIQGKQVTIINFHGLWNGKGKTDTEDRLNQSRRIVKFAETMKGPKILCGDFNLLPDTESLKILENHGMRNLIKEYGITNTRTPLYPRAHLSSSYADYILITPDIKVNDFKALQDVVSDHAPLFLDFEVM
jgi:endonuclease/exonuclease/phosphatase family metal-dependent hydrolase